MEVVSVKVAAIRPKHNNLVEWLNDNNNVHIGRHGRVFVNGEVFAYAASRWCNPYKVGKDGILDEVLIKYEIYLDGLLKSEEPKRELETLRGETLGCWCKYPNKNAKCHGDIILKKLG